MPTQGILTQDTPAIAEIAEASTPEEIVAWTLRRFAGRNLVVTTSFGMEGCALIDMVARHGVGAPGGLPRHRCSSSPRPTRCATGWSARYPRPPVREPGHHAHARGPGRALGPELWRRDPDRCCALRKVEPMRQRAGGRRRLDHRRSRGARAARARRSAGEWDGEYQLVKMNPLAGWDRRRGLGLRARARRALQRAARAGLPDARLHPLHRRRCRASAPARVQPRADAGPAPRRPSAGCTAIASRQLRTKGVSARDDRTNPNPRSRSPSATAGTSAAPSRRRSRPSATHFEHDDVAAAQVPRHLPAGLPRRAARAARRPARRRPTPSWSGWPSPPARSPAEQYLAPRADRRRARQRHPPGHHPAGIPVPRRAQGRPQGRPSPASTRSCSPPSPPAATCSATSWAAPRRWATPTTPRCGAVAEALARELRPAIARLPRDLARRREAGLDRGRRSRSTATATCRGSSRPRSASRPTTAWTSTPRTSGCSRSSRDGRIQGFNLLVGGGLGMTHNKGDTTARLAQPLGFVPTGARGRGGAPRGRDLPRPRQPVRPAARPAQVPDRRVGHDALPGGVPAARLVPARRRRCRFRRCRSTTTSAATASATAAAFYGVFIQSGRIVDTAGPRAQDRAARDRHPAPARRPAHRRSRTCCSPISTPTASRRSSASSGARGHPADPSSRPRGGSRWPAPPSRPAGWRWPNRSGRFPAILDQFEAELDEPRPARRAAHHPDDRLPQRLRPALHRRPRLRRAARSGSTTCTSAAGWPATGWWISTGPTCTTDELLDAVRPLLQRWAAERDRGRGAGRLLPAAHGSRGATRTVVTGRELPTIDLVPLRGGPVSGRALVLAAHGSRRDPAANALVRRLAEAVRGRRLFDEVAVAFHQGEPGFDTRARRARGRRGDGGAAAHQRGPLQRGGAARGAGAEPAVRRGAAPADAAGGHPSGRGAAGGAPGDRAAARAAHSTGDDVALVLVGHGTRRHPAEPGRHRAARRDAPAPAGGGRGGRRRSSTTIRRWTQVAARLAGPSCWWCRSSSGAAPTRSRTCPGSWACAERRARDGRRRRGRRS